MTALTMTIALAAVALHLAAPDLAAGPSRTIAGTVTDQSGKPLLGASVILAEDTAVIAGTSTDAQGRFRIRLSPAPSTTMEIRVSCVSFHPRVVRLDSLPDTTAVNIILRPRLVELTGITVAPAPEPNLDQLTLGATAIRQSARTSLVSTNPVGGLSEPHISRVGSSHSSKIRINGTSPAYYLNGVPIGFDPDHYGIFTIIPSSMVSRLEFNPQGTQADFGLPSVIAMETPSPFDCPNSGELNLSMLEATAQYAVSGPKWFAAASVRKSVLDKLVKRFDISSDRQTLPPTNFQDVVGSAGWKLSGTTRLYIDHYNVRDFFSYNTGDAVDAAHAVSARQSSTDRMLAVWMQTGLSRISLKAILATRRSNRVYQATPANLDSPADVALDLAEDLHSHFTSAEAVLEIGHIHLTAGGEGTFVTYRSVDMTQTNWNFLPPFTNSDNPYVYQKALNDTYGSYHDDEGETNAAAYLSSEVLFGEVTIQSGIRADYFSTLSDRNELTFRQQVNYCIGERGAVELYFGTFAENPVNNILEPYQVLVHANLARLTPIKSQIARIDVTLGDWRVGVFDKRLNDLPLMAPDFDHVYDKSGGIDQQFIAVTSTGRALFYGGQVVFQREGFLSPALDLEVSYAYTKAYRMDHGLRLPHELIAPHQARMQTDYRASSRLRLGLELYVRSGYPYTPSDPGAIPTGESELYSQDYYQTVIAEENSSRFPTNAALNLSATYAWDTVELFAAVTNVSNRANPIINSGSRYIYDAGILPTIGLRWQF